MKKNFRIRISFYMIGCLVEFMNDGFLLSKVAELIETERKIIVGFLQ